MLKDSWEVPESALRSLERLDGPRDDGVEDEGSFIWRVVWGTWSPSLGDLNPSAPDLTRCEGAGGDGEEELPPRASTSSSSSSPMRSLCMKRRESMLDVVGWRRMYSKSSWQA